MTKAEPAANKGCDSSPTCFHIDLVLSFNCMLRVLNEGEATTRLLKNRGRIRGFYSRLLTGRMRRKLCLAKNGRLSLPSVGPQDSPPISLTSWPPRYDSLPLVLLNLLSQDLLPSKILVWLTASDHARLDPGLIALFERSLVEFRLSDDFGPHKKWLPKVEEGSAPFVICDDDTFYPPGWFRALVSEADPAAYVAHRCHWMTIAKDGSLSAYADWPKDISSPADPSHRLFPTGCGGTLIHPDRIPKSFRDWNTIYAMCPRADDIWLKLAHLSTGVVCRKTRYSFPCIEYSGSQSSGLMNDNADRGGNDRQLRQAISGLGFDLPRMICA
jgi:hypothetical protein